MDTALVRPVADSFSRALVGEAGSALDPDRARRHHADYVALLDSAGYTIEEVAGDEAHPDCVFIEDTAVVLGSVAVIARSGASSRRGEAAPVRDALTARFSIATIDAPGTLDGGDVMQVGGKAYVGHSARTNPAAIEQLAEIATGCGLEVTTVRVHDGLHLKSSVLPLDAETVLVTPNSVDEDALNGLRIVREAPTERFRASALPMRDGRLVITTSAPATSEMLASIGYDVVPIDVTELQAADGGLTCMSILFHEPVR
jgi:dimethylargininase